MSFDTYLQHYGIPKMKWGIRRYQNKDGSLTEEGRYRYLKNPDRSKAIDRDVSTISDDELNKVSKRNELEKRYIQSVVDRSRAVSSYNELVREANKSKVQRFFEGRIGKQIIDSSMSEFQKALNNALKSLTDKIKGPEDNSWRKLTKKDLDKMSIQELKDLSVAITNYNSIKGKLKDIA